MRDEIRVHADLERILARLVAPQAKDLGSSAHDDSNAAIRAVYATFPQLEGPSPPRTPRSACSARKLLLANARDLESRITLPWTCSRRRRSSPPR